MGRVAWLITALWLAVSAPALAKAPLATTFDCASGHQFAGFGVEVWSLPGRQQPLLDLVKRLRVKFARWDMLPFPDDADVPDGVSFESLINWIEDTGAKYKARDFALAERLRSLGVEQLHVTWRVPAKWRRGGLGVPPDRSNQQIINERAEDYGRLVAAQMAVLQRRGIRPYAVELLNEPGNRIAPPQYARVLRTFRSWQSRSALPSLPVAGPGTGLTWGNRRYIEAVVQQGEKLDIATTHAYDARMTHQLASLAAFRAAIPPAWRSPVFVTEFGIDPESWFNSPDAAATITYGVAAAAQALALLDSGANAIFYWQAQDPPRARRAMGLLDKEDRPRPVLEAFSTLLRPLAAGDKVAFSGNRAEAQPIAVFARQSQLVVQMANTDSEAQDYTISFRNCGATPLVVGQTESWPTGQTVEVRAVSGSAWHVSVPRQVVASITLRPQ
jgi:hypothetical protein